MEFCAPILRWTFRTWNFSVETWIDSRPAADLNVSPRANAASVCSSRRVRSNRRPARASFNGISKSTQVSGGTFWSKRFSAALILSGAQIFINELAIFQ